MLDSLLPQPASIQKSNFDIVAWNDAFSRMMGVDFHQIPEDERNCIYLYLTNPTWRSRIGRKESVLPTFVAYFRAAMAEHRGDPQWEAKLARFCAVSEEFASLWHKRYDVRGVENQLKTFTHPELGEFSLQQMYWFSAPRNGSRLLVYLPIDERASRRWHGWQSTLSRFSKIEFSGQDRMRLACQRYPAFCGERNLQFAAAR